MKCVRCDSEAGLIIDGPMTLRLCEPCHKTWLGSEQRHVIRGSLFTFALRAGWAWVENPERTRQVIVRNPESLSEALNSGDGTYKP